MESRVVFQLEQGDITTVGADVVAVKYAQKFYGADGVIADNLGRKGVAYSSIQSAVGSHRFLASQGAITANQVLFVGVLPLFQFGYREIRAFGRSVLRILQQEAPRCKHLAMTIHGPGYGMDETEACFAQLQGYLDAFKAGQAPDALERISIVDRNSDRILRLRRALEATSISLPLEYVSEGCWLFPPMGGNPSATSSAMPAPPLVSVEAGGPPKPHIFVAMPFSTHMDDVFYFGIQQPVHLAGFLCERMDHVSFAGGIVDWIKRKIETASAVIAELSGANPNVYLEVGYAWAKERPTILLAPRLEELAFDVKGQRCLVYDGIKNLQDLLAHELAELQVHNLM